MDILRWESELDGGLAEGAIDRHVELVDCGQAVLQTRQETAEDEVQRAVAERLEGDHRRRIFKDHRVLSGDLQ